MSIQVAHGCAGAQCSQTHCCLASYNKQKQGWAHVHHNWVDNVRNINRHKLAADASGPRNTHRGGRATLCGIEVAADVLSLLLLLVSLCCTT
jgi:hypothetical protein